jgi:hypothetical protein
MYSPLSIFDVRLNLADLYRKKKRGVGHVLLAPTILFIF